MQTSFLEMPEIAVRHTHTNTHTMLMIKMRTFIHPLTRSLTHSLTHSLNHSFHPIPFCITALQDSQKETLGGFHTCATMMIHGRFKSNITEHLSFTLQTACQLGGQDPGDPPSRRTHTDTKLPVTSHWHCLTCKILPGFHSNFFPKAAKKKIWDRRAKHN